MAFKVIIKHPSETNDEHTYYGMVFLRDGRSKIKRLEYSNTEKNLQEEFVFDGKPVEPNENYLALLLAVNESETIRNPVFKIQFNNPAPVPEIVNFP
ncbi:hypothetical protein [Candidatus Nitrosocosmicus arcticus]|uniref:Uncharacterized protein n=1 Tax=Candidatus Nitrosocosmicus arcticus TaxID=2035267 RepID=A0A557SZB3_9ARCH|nr:hypothetical protein [Candidatus Nitrosocosmicus arcticus]TVP41950.1 hypothetical protein NARC_10356 [Candidatus Nitrosocosmicus arcticus]